MAYALPAAASRRQGSVLIYSIRQIRANAVSPGNVPTEATRTIGHLTDEMLVAAEKMIPIRRLGTPTDIAAAVVWLASPAGSWVTGQNIVVSGGQ